MALDILFWFQFLCLLLHGASSKLYSNSVITFVGLGRYFHRSGGLISDLVGNVDSVPFGYVFFFSFFFSHDFNHFINVRYRVLHTSCGDTFSRTQRVGTTYLQVKQLGSVVVILLFLIESLILGLQLFVLYTIVCLERRSGHDGCVA